MSAFLKHQRDLWNSGVYWPLLWLTIRHPFTPKHLYVTPRGHEVRLHEEHDRFPAGAG